MRTPTERVGLSGVSRLTIAGESSVSSDSRRAAAARKSVRAKVDHLPGEFAIGPSRIAGAGVRRDRSTDEWCLAKLDGHADDAAEDVVIADDAQLIEHVAGEVGPAIEERREKAEDPEVAIQLETDRVDHLDQVVESLHR